MKHEARILVSTTDLDRLQRLIEQNQDGRNAAQAELLEQELHRAVVLSPEQLPADVVTMNSTVLFEDEETHLQRQLTLCYPADAKGDDTRVSVLAPEHGGRFEAKLVDVSGEGGAESATLDMDGKQKRVPLSAVKEARLAFRI